MNGEELKCTAEHPFYVVKRDEFVPARNLKKGDELLQSDGRYGIIETVEVERLSEPETTYNFEVAEYHTYYVGNGILTHNKCVQPVGSANPIKGKPNSTALRWANNGKIYSATTYDNMGRQVSRIDFYGKAHFIKNLGDGIMPHVHTFYYWKEFMNDGDIITFAKYMGGL